MTSIDPSQARELLLEEQTRLQQIRASLDQEPVGAPEGDVLGELSYVDQHPADLASETFEQEKDASILEHVDAQLSDVSSALERLESGTYGRCEICGREIDEDRLRARPATRFCVEDQARVERGVA